MQDYHLSSENSTPKGAPEKITWKRVLFGEDIFPCNIVWILSGVGILFFSLYLLLNIN